MKLLAAVGFGLCAFSTGLGPEIGARPKAPSPTPRVVAIVHFTFVPPDLVVAPGDTVVWTNDDPFLHTVAADSGAWTSPEIARGERFVVVAGKPGRFPYHCAAHPVMRGVITVGNRQ